MKLTQKQFDNLVEAMNHRLTKLEVHANWIKWIVGGIFISTIVGTII